MNLRDKFFVAIVCAVLALIGGAFFVSSNPNLIFANGQLAPNQGQPIPFLGPQIGTSGYYGFVYNGQNCAWAIGATGVYGDLPTISDCLVLNYNGRGSMFFLAPAPYAPAHSALFVSGSGSIHLRYLGFDQTIQLIGRDIGIGFRPNDAVWIEFNGQQQVWWSEDQGNLAQYGPGGIIAVARGNIDWLANEVPTGSGWFSIISNEYRRDHPGQTCAESILFRNVLVESGKHIPMTFCGLWTLQSQDPSNTISGLISFNVKAGPAYDVCRQSIAEPGLTSPQCALWFTGGSFKVEIDWNGRHQEFRIPDERVSGASVGVAFNRNSPVVHIKITALKRGSRALMEWGPDVPPWCAKYGPAAFSGCVN